MHLESHLFLGLARSALAFFLFLSVGVAREQSAPALPIVASLFIVATLVIVKKVETSRKKLRIGRAILPVN